MLAPYEIVSKLGPQGPFDAELARSPGDPQRALVLMRISSGLSVDPGSVRAFIDASRIILPTRHPNLVRIVDVGADDRGLYYVTEYVRGISLAAILRRLAQTDNTLSLDDALIITQQCLFGLAAACEQVGAEVVHGDICPDSLQITFDGLIRLRHFRVDLLGWSGQRQDGMSVPERQDGSVVDARTDLYSLAALFLLCVGADQIHVDQRLLPIETPEHWGGVLRSCLSKDPGDRPGSADEVLSVLGLQSRLGVDEAALQTIADRVAHLFGGSELSAQADASWASVESGEVTESAGAMSDSVSDADSGEPLLRPESFWAGSRDESELVRHMTAALESLEPSGPAELDGGPAGDEEEELRAIPPRPIEVDSGPAEVLPEPFRPESMNGEAATGPVSPPQVRPLQLPNARPLPARSFQARQVSIRRAAPPGPQRSIWLIAAASLILVAALLGLWMGLGGDAPIAPQPEPPLVEKDIAPAPDRGIEKTPDPIEQGSTPEIDGAEVTLRVTSEPSAATVFVKDEPRGQTPVNLKLPAGAEVEIAVVLKGFLPWRQMVRLGEPGADQAIHAGLLKEQVCPKGRGWIYVSSDPSGAMIFIDGKRQPGKTPKVISGLCANVRYALRVELPGHKPWQREVKVRTGGDVRNVKVKLVPYSGR